MSRYRVPPPVTLDSLIEDTPLILLTPPAIGGSPASTYSSMSLVASRHMDDRPSSSSLGTITCSSCAAQIPLDDLGSHVCRPPSRNNRPARPNLMIPPPVAGPSSAGSSFRGPGSYQTERSNSPLPRSISPLPPFASGSSARPSPSMLQVPGSGAASAQSSPNGLPGWPGLSPAATTPSPSPSPTNPFFPSSARASPQPGTVVHGLGLGVGSAGRRGEGPYPTDRPLPVELQVSDPTRSGDGANMAGVGRRGFQAAALTVRAGVALANNARQPQQQPASQAPSSYRPPPHHAQVPPMNIRPTAPFAQPPGPRSASPLDRPPQAPWNQTPSASPAKSEPAHPVAARSESPAMRGPILPRVPLSGRQRSGAQSAGSGPARPELHRGQTMPSSPVHRAHATNEQQRGGYPSPKRATTSVERSHRPPPLRTQSDASPSLTASPNPDDNIATLLKARNNGHVRKQSNGGAFFDRYKQLSDSARSSADNKGLGIRRGSETSDHLVASPQQTTFSLDDMSDDEDSALPWAKPPKPSHGAGQASDNNNRRDHAGSIGSGSASSSQAGWQGPPSGPESEEVITPSQSWDGLADRANGREPSGRTKGADRSNGSYDRDDRGLNDIGEEDENEGDRVVFGQGAPTPRRRSNDFGGARLQNSSSSSTIKATIPAARRPALAVNAGELHIRSRTAPIVDAERPDSRHTDYSHARSATSASSRGKSCQKCGESVGGTKRFVERDGVVLCEKDWKKLYLPACRRCNLPIEKSAVSSSDGQLKGKWHRACFTCTKCDQAFEGDSFYVLGGKPWCQYHYHEENATLCASAFCRRPIEGQCVLTTGSNPQRFHPGHLRCDHRSVCREPMNEYYEVEGKRYCERHVEEYTRRAVGGKDIRAEKRRTRLVDLPRGGLGF